MANKTCAHLGAITNVKHAKRRECEECAKIGGQWVHLRTCQTCGATLVVTTRRIATPQSTPARANIPLSPQQSPESVGCIAIPTMPLPSIEQ